MKEEDIKQFFMTLYEDLMLFNMDKQRLSYDCGRFNLICNITFELQKKEDKSCNP